MSERDIIDAMKYMLLATKEPKVEIKRIECKGVGDLDGYFEITIKNPPESGKKLEGSDNA